MIKKIAVLLLFVSHFCFASFNVYDFADKHEEARFKSLITELRCPKCQNNNLADSNAELATDIKNLVYRAIKEGQSDQQIRDYLISRYGEFVTYKPVFKGYNIIVWLLPIILIIISIIVIIINRRSASPQDEKPIEQDMNKIIHDYKQEQQGKE